VDGGLLTVILANVVETGNPTVNTGSPAEFHTALAPVPLDDSVTLSDVAAFAEPARASNPPVIASAALPPANSCLILCMI
jgi:hypothetical protein